MKGFVLGGVLAVLMLLCADEVFSAAVLAAAWIVVCGVVAVLDMAKRKARAET